MNSVIICFVGLFFAFMVNTVLGICEDYPTLHGVMNAPFHFAFLGETEYNFLMMLKNVSPKIIAIKVAVETDDPASNSYKHYWDRDRGDEGRLCGKLSHTYNKLVIGLELYSSNGLCATKAVAEGRHPRILQYGLADSSYQSGHFCMFSRNACAIEIDLRNYCREIKTARNETRKILVTPKPKLNIPYTTRNTSVTQKPKIVHTPKAKQNISHTTPSTSITPKPQISHTPRAKQNISHTPLNTTITPKPTISDTPKLGQNFSHTTRNTSVTPKATNSDTPNAIQNVSDTSKSTWNISNTSNATGVVWNIADTFNTTLNLSDTSTAIQNISDTPNVIDSFISNAVYNKYTISIAVTFGMALFLLVVIVTIRKRCWIKRTSSSTPELLSNDQTSPFYLNLLFRRECEQEIELIEQHHYEEINPQ